MNYKDEHAHDWLLISLVEDLNSAGQLALIKHAFNTPELGNLEHAQRRQPFDVELTFENLSIVVETKVDSDESGRWDEEWQTDRIVATAESLDYLKENKEFVFITYGTSEFYTKPYETNAASKKFKHIGLDRMIDFVSRSLQADLPKKREYEEWLYRMEIERDKRINSVTLLRQFSIFRQTYLSLHGENDFPNNRFVFCAPELAFPVFWSLANEWNNSERATRFGKVSLYPVTRMSPPVQDSVLNFWGLWDSGKPEIGRELIADKDHGFYLEINEDFNLNLKFEAEDLDLVMRDAVWQRLSNVKWPSFVNAVPRQYKQGTYVLYEFDFGFFNDISDMKKVADQLEETVSCVVGALA